MNRWGLAIAGGLITGFLLPIGIADRVEAAPARHIVVKPFVKRTAKPIGKPIYLRRTFKPVVIGRMVPCVFEDGSGGSLPCYWDATTRGNRTGRSFWVDAQGTFHYTS